ncbi:MAG: hypothetical protein V4565_12985 [Bacteroidota bacterium]
MITKTYFYDNFKLVLAIIFFFNIISAQPTLDWAKHFKGTGSDEGICIQVDKAGNVYTAGYFWGLTDFNPGPGMDTLRAIGTDGFITKFNSQGNLIWVKHISGYSSQTPFGLALDDSSNIYIPQTFKQEMKFIV